MLCVLYQLGRMASITYLMALPLHHLLGWPVAGIIVVMGVLVIAYTLVGGIEAVIWTDLIQTVVLVGGALVAVGFLVSDVPGGLRTVLRVAWLEGKLSPGSLGPSLSESTFWVVVAFGLMENLRNLGIDQTFVQRSAAVAGGITGTGGESQHESRACAAVGGHRGPVAGALVP